MDKLLNKLFDKYSTKTILIAGGVLTVILLIIVVALFTPKEEPVSNIDIDNLYNRPITLTPIKEGVVSEEIAEKELYNDESLILNPVSEADAEKFEEEITIPEGIYPPEFENIWETYKIDEAGYTELFGFNWIAEVIFNPISYRFNFYKLTMPVHFEEDANEEKERTLYIINSFIQRYSNVIYSRNTQIKNLYDIPEDGVYILSDEEDGYYSLRIFPMGEDANYFYIYLTATTKKNQISRDTNAWTRTEMNDIEEILDSLGRLSELDEVMMIGTQVVKKDNDSTNFTEIDPSELTPEQRTLMAALGL